MRFKRPGIKRRKYLIFFLFLMIAIGVLYAGSTSYAICRVWLPFISTFSDTKVSAKSVELSVFRKTNLSAVDFRYQDGRAHYLELDTVAVSLDLWELLNGTIAVRELTLDGMRVRLVSEATKIRSEEPTFSSMEKTAVPPVSPRASSERGIEIPRIPEVPELWRCLERFRVSKLDAKGLELQISEFESSAEKCHLLIHRLSVRDFIPGQECSVEMSGIASIQTPTWLISEHPLDLSVKLNLSDNGSWPTELEVAIRSVIPVRDAETGDKEELNLSAGCHLKHDESSTVVLEKLYLTEEFEGKREFYLDVCGVFRPDDQTANLKISVDGHMNQLRFLRFLRKNQWHPEELDVKMETTIGLRDQQITSKGQMELNLDSLSYAGKPYAQNLCFRLQKDMQWDQRLKNITFRALDLHLTEKSGLRLHAASNGSVTFSLPSEQVSLANFESEDARFSLTLVNLSHRFSTPFTDLWEGGIFSAHTNLKGSHVKGEGEALLTLDFRCPGLKIRNVLDEVNVSGSMELENKEQFSRHIAPKIMLSILTNAHDPPQNLTLYGDYNSRKKTLGFRGQLTCNPAELVSVIRWNNAKQVTQYMEKVGASDTSFRAEYDFSQSTGQLDLLWNIKNLDFIAKEYNGRKLACHFFLLRNQKRIQQKLHLSSPELIDLTCDSSKLRSNESIRGSVHLKSLDAEFLTRLFLFADDKSAFPRWSRAFSLDQYQLDTEFVFDRKNDVLTLNQTKIQFKTHDGGILQVGLPDPTRWEKSKILVKTPEFSLGKIKLNAENFDLCTLNPLFPKPAIFHFQKGITSGQVTGSLEVQWPTKAILEFTPDLRSPDLQMHIVERDYHFGQSHATGGFQVDCRKYGFLAFRNARGRIDEGQGADFTLNGEIAFFHHRSHLLKAMLRHLDRKTFADVFPALAEVVQLHDGILSGSGQWESDTASDRYVLDLHAAHCRSGYLPGVVAPSSVDLELGLDAVFGLAARQWALQKVSVNLLSGRKQPVAELMIQGTFPAKASGERARFNLHAKQADLVQLSAMLKTPESEEEPRSTVSAASEAQSAQTPAATVSEASTSQVDAGKQNVGWFPTGWDADLALDLNHLTYTKHLTLDVKGGIEFRKDRIDTNSMNLFMNRHEASVNARWERDPSGNTPFFLSLSVKQMPLEELFYAFFPWLETKKIGIDARALKCQLSGPGLTWDSLKQNADGALSMELGTVELPIQAKDTFFLSELIFLPLEAMPSIVNLISENPMPQGGGNMGSFQPVSSILSGKDNLVFHDGTIQLRMDNGICQVRDFRLNGLVVNMNIEQGTVNPFTGELDLLSVLDFRVLKFPIALSGTIDHVTVDFARFPLDFAKVNASNFLDRTLSLLQNAVFLGKKETGKAGEETEELFHDLDPFAASPKNPDLEKTQDSSAH